MKIFTKSLMMMCAIASVSMATAAEYVTLGDGTNYTMESLSAIEGSGIVKDTDGVYIMNNDVTISAGDSFTMESGVTVKMGNATSLILSGDANFDCTTTTTFTRNAETDAPKGVYVNSDLTDVTFQFTNINFEYAGLRAFITASLEMNECSFSLNNGASSSSAAFAINQSGGNFTVTNCTFSENEVPAIGTGANVSVSLTIEDCTFIDNNTDNSNKPQLNLTVGGDKDIIIKNSVLKGAQRTKVGGISVSNLMSIAGTNNVIIEGNDIREHRYAITTMGPLNARIINNVMIDNKYETNPMNGGSGISIYDTSYAQDVYVEGNHIEGSLWGITVIGGKNVNIGKTEVPSTADDYNPGKNVFINNGNGGVLYDLYNNGSNTIYAQGNTWNVANQTADEIETVIFHKNDDASLGEVIYMDNSGLESNISVKTWFDSINKQIVGLDNIDTVYVYATNGVLVAQVVVENGIADMSNIAAGTYIAQAGKQSIKVVL